LSFLCRGLRHCAGSSEHVVGLKEDGGRERQAEVLGSLQVQHQLELCLERAGALPDNHLEGSAIERYSQVVEAVNNLGHNPIEETEMSLYGGIDLHANNRVVVLRNEQDQMI
jgi:hypothetical protein